MYDVIPDLHGQAEKLKNALLALGYRERGHVWRHSDPQRKAVFLGDFIDRGPHNAEVIGIVRRMIDAGSGLAIMGNHELNAIHFHTLDPATGNSLRIRSPKNTRQHQAFLNEFPVGDAKTKEAIAWMRTLPLFLEFEDFRAVHACWNADIIDQLRPASPSGVLTEDDLLKAADRSDPLHRLVEITTKGPEIPLPHGFKFQDKDGSVRSEVRLKWWNANSTRWREMAISVPVPSELPEGHLPADIVSSIYPSDAKPVFFGHYWLDGTPFLQAPNALCLDYSAGKDGPLVTYQMDTQPGHLDLEYLTIHGKIG